MHRIFLFLILNFVFINCSFSESKCFIAKEGKKILRQEGNCNKRYSPCSTFKIPLSLIGYNERILINQNNPKWADKSGNIPDRCKGTQTPITWIQKSCVWYSRVITHKLGMKKFKEYIDKFNYGNRNVLGGNGNGGLDSAWLSSSLKISPVEQISFIEKLIRYSLPVSKSAHDNTMHILYVDNLQNGWKLFGKTGSGFLSSEKDSENDEQIGGFLGYIQNGERKIVFVQFIEGKIKGPAGPHAKDIAKERLSSLIIGL